METRFDYRPASESDLKWIWQKNIDNNPDEPAWVRWRDEFIGYNRDGWARTFVVCAGEEPVGEVTLMISQKCKPTIGRPLLADEKHIANVNALRIEKAYEGQGHVSKLMQVLESDAKARGIDTLTIGVEAKEARNLAIYLHWGYTQFVMSEEDEGELILYYAKTIR